MALEAYTPPVSGKNQSVNGYEPSGETGLRDVQSGESKV